ncbi:MAG: toll/interleukin-1 receptor domain-containing protein [Hydrogenophilaceae bacterium]|jgi:hypothetical protein|nr:toll/interleukin-1 receptor domain-containing protein [Hydrogenophilaceae bacterium]
MSFIFVSHASEDKRLRVRALVETLIAEGEHVWIDRPGAGDNNFGFDQAYIDAHGIDHLNSGQSWSQSIASALNHAGAVLGCFSQALAKEKSVWEQELYFAAVSNKLVACIIDDLPFDDLAQYKAGIADFAATQAPRIDCAALRAALDWRAHTGQPAEALPSALREEWEKVRNLIADANKRRTEPRSLSAADIRRCAARLARVPVGPILTLQHIPEQVIVAMARGLGTPERAAAALTQTQSILAAAFPEGYEPRQIYIEAHELPMIGAIPSHAFWTQVFGKAGLKGRRTVVALLITPIGQWALQRGEAQVEAERLAAALEMRNALT